MDAGVSPSYLGQVERGTRNVSVDLLWRLADQLGTVPSVLLEEAERQTSSAQPENKPVP